MDKKNKKRRDKILIMIGLILKSEDISILISPHGA